MESMKSKMQLADSDSLKLIKEVKKRGCIWNPEDKNYCERYHLAEAWEEISKKLDKPEDLLRAKWKNLRDFFKKQVKKNNVESPEEYCGKWRHFKTLEFLLRPSDHDQPASEPEDFETKYVPDTNLEVYLQEPPEKRPRLNDEEDYDSMFLKSLTPFLKQLEPTRNLVVRNKIQDMLLNEIAAQGANRTFLKKS